MMDPNSQHQYWSKWTITVAPGARLPRTTSEVRHNVGRFLRKVFGSTADLKGRRYGHWWQFTALVEDAQHVAHDPAYVSWLTDQLTHFFTVGFGVSTRVTVTAKLMAGSLQDGRPAEQLLILPSLKVM